jgi:GxxExxY protein
MYEPTSEQDLVARHVVDAAFRVHETLGPGLLESVYERCLGYELETRDIPFCRQVRIPISYRKYKIDAGLRIDLVVADQVIVEVKATERLMPVHEAQLDTYLRLSGYTLGFLINFNVVLIKHGIRRRICSRCAMP